MTRRLPVLCAVFLAGCGGSGGLLATVPPPVEFTALPMGVAEVPKAGVREGDVVVEHVVVTKLANGEYDESIASSVASAAAEAEIGEDGTITLRRLGEHQILFRGTLMAETGTQPKTYADLRAFDGNVERFPYTYRKDPFGMDIVARTWVRPSGRNFEFDRYRFAFR